GKNRMTNRALFLTMIIGLLFASCGGAVTSDEQARLAYLGLDNSVDRAIVLGLEGFAAAKSANIPAQTGNGNIQGTMTISGQVDQGSSDNKEMRLVMELVNYSDVQDYVYSTTEAAPQLDLSLKKIPNGTMTGTLTGDFEMTGLLIGTVHLSLNISSQLEENLQTGFPQRKAGTVNVTGTAESDFGTYTVEVTH
ncbi:MAG: hypothetical protein V1754_03980, partial [Pseudomonadota bacterium]